MSAVWNLSMRVAGFATTSTSKSRASTSTGSHGVRLTVTIAVPSYSTRVVTFTVSPGTGCPTASITTWCGVLVTTRTLVGRIRID